MNSPRVCFVGHSLVGPGGVARSAHDVLDALQKHTTHLLVVTTGSPLQTFLTNLRAQKRLRVHTLRPFHHAPNQTAVRATAHFPRAALKSLLWLAQLALLWLRVKLARPNVVIVNGLGSHKLWRHMHSFIGGKSTLIVRESPRHFPTDEFSLQWAIQAMASYDNIIFVSARTQAEWQALAPLRAAHTFYIPNCCNEEEVQRIMQLDRATALAQTGMAASDFNIVCVGTLQARKGQDLIVANMARLTTSIPNVKFYFIGTSLKGWGEALLAQIRNSEFAERIVWLGERPDALLFTYAADVALLPARAEAMPRVILEAAALCKPIVASDVDGIPEIVTHGESALLFSHAQPNQMAEHLERLYQDRALAQTLASNAHARYWQMFSRQQLVERYGEVLPKLR